MPVGHEFVLRFPGSMGILNLGLILTALSRIYELHITLHTPCRVCCLAHAHRLLIVWCMQHDGVPD